MLNELQNEKDRMRTQLIIAGEYEVDGGMITYAELIRGLKNRFMRKIKFGDSTWENAPYIDISRHEDCTYMFDDCKNLKTFQPLNTSRVITMFGMFLNCSSLEIAPEMDTSNVKIMRNMFEGCVNLTSVPLYDTSNVTDMSFMFRYCENLTTIPQFDTSKLESIGYMFEGCVNLTSVPELNGEKIGAGGNVFEGCVNLTDFGGFKNYGQEELMFTTAAGGANGNNDIYKDCEKLTYSSLMNIINNLYDRKKAGYDVINLIFHENAFSKLSSKDIAIATNKGWTLSYQ